MFDAPVETWYLWVGVAVASIALFGVATSLPSAPAPPAAAAADAVDTVAAVDSPETAERPLDAAEVKLGSGRISLRADGQTAHATFVYGPVTPVRDGTLLWEVLRGAEPGHVFDSPAAFRRAVREAQRRPPTWRVADETLTIRSTTWEGVDAVLVRA